MLIVLLVSSINDVLQCASDAKFDLHKHNIRFVTFRNNLNKVAMRSS